MDDRRDRETILPASSGLRLLVCAAHFDPHTGGVERYTKELWSRVANLGWSIVVLTGNTDAAPVLDEVGPLTVIRLPVVQIIHRRYPILIPSRELIRQVKHLSKWKPDAVVTNTRFFSTTALGLILGKSVSAPTLHVDHGSRHIDFPSPMLTWLGKVIDHTVGSWVLRGATRVVGVSEAVSEFLRHLGSRDPGVLYNGVNAASFLASNDRVLRKRLGISNETVVITYLGRLIQAKGIEGVLEAFSRSRHRDQAALVIAGDGHMMDEVRRRAATTPNIHILGPVSPAAVPELLESSDVLVHFSAYPEGLPTVVLEAGAAGLAIIATPMGGTAEIIAGPEYGVLLEPNDVTGLAAAIDDLIENQSKREMMGRNVRELVKSKFDWSEIAKSADGILREMISSREPRDG